MTRFHTLRIVRIAAVAVAAALPATAAVTSAAATLPPPGPSAPVEAGQDR